jgi:signal peptidase II
LYGLQAEGRTSLTLRIRKYLAFSLFVAYLLDYASKFLALKYLGEHPKKILGTFLQLNLTVNHGAAFSLGNSFGSFFAIFAVVFLAVIFYVGNRIDSIRWAVALGILAGGVTGNLSDRLFRAPGKLQGGVVDWIQIPHWPTFNISDVAIDIGILLCLILWLKKKPLNSQRSKNV